MKPRNNYLKELQRRQEAAKSTEALEPKATQPEALPADPEVRVEWLQDELTNRRTPASSSQRSRRNASDPSAG